VQLKGGIGEAGDPYERHADAVADAVVAGRSAEGLLEPMIGAPAREIEGRAPQVQQRVDTAREPLIQLESEGLFGLAADTLSGRYDYQYNWAIAPVGPGISAKKVMAELQGNPNAYFPFQVQAVAGDLKGYPIAGIQLGARLNLSGPRTPIVRGALISGLDDSNHVVVTARSDTSFTFTTQADHFDGAGGTITFSTYEAGGTVYLQNTGVAPTAGIANSFLVNFGQGARGAWLQMASRLIQRFYRGGGPSSSFASPR